MKIQIILTALLCMVLFACGHKDKQSFLPGTYVNSSTGKYSVASDTLVIEADEANRFKINRRTGFNLIRNGKKGKREHETENWSAVFDEGTGILNETRRGKVIRFYPDSNVLVIGNRTYQKIN